MLTKLLILSLGLLPIFTVATHSTLIEITDVELNALLQLVFNSIGASKIIPISLLDSLGLNSESVIYYLMSIGYYILY
jgi:hypothetical protein